MKTSTERAIEELRNFMKAFESTINVQKYETNVFDCLNKRYIEAGKIIEEYEFIHSHPEPERKTAEEIVEESFKGLSQFIKDKDVLIWYKSLIVTCIEEFASQSIELPSYKEIEKGYDICGFKGSCNARSKETIPYCYHKFSCPYKTNQ